MKILPTVGAIAGAVLTATALTGANTALAVVPPPPTAAISFSCADAGRLANIVVVNTSATAIEYTVLVDGQPVGGPRTVGAQSDGQESIEHGSDDTTWTVAIVVNGNEIASQGDFANCFDATGSVEFQCGPNGPMLHFEAANTGESPVGITYTGAGTSVSTTLAAGETDSHDLPVVNGEIFAGEISAEPGGILVANNEGTADCPPPPTTVPGDTTPSTTPSSTTPPATSNLLPATR